MCCVGAEVTRCSALTADCRKASCSELITADADNAFCLIWPSPGFLRSPRGPSSIQCSITPTPELFMALVPYSGSYDSTRAWVVLFVAVIDGFCLFQTFTSSLFVYILLHRKIARRYVSG